ncbi:MAG: DNA polymerase I [Dehalococcoidia bacterium]
MTQRKPVLILFDGHSLIHRAFHALPSLNTREGQPTGAVYGFASMLLKVLNDYNPTHCVVTFDSAAPTFRHVEFEEYKAQRPKAPDELVSQFPIVRELVQALNITSFEVEGYEADDILGTLSIQAASLGIETLIVTGDTDILQLVSPGVRVILPKPRKPFSDTQLFDEESVRQKYDLNPERIADLKGLVGDPSDNIPGVPGVGKKTASKLLKDFNSIEDIYAHIAEVKPEKLREKLISNEQAARQSKSLATINTDAPANLDLADCELGSYDRDRLIQLFRKLEFSSLLNRLPQGSGNNNGISHVDTALTTDYTIVDTTEKFENMITGISGAEILSIDTETTNVNPRKAGLVGISLSTRQGKAWYIPVGHTVPGEQLPLPFVSSGLKPILGDSGIPLTAHNAKYDITVLARHGIKVTPPHSDTMIAAYLLGEKSLGLKQLAFNKLSVEMVSIADLIGTGSRQRSMAEIEIGRVAEYACADADMTLRLNLVLENEMRQEGLRDLFAEVEMPLVPVLHQMEENGMALDTDLLTKISRELNDQLRSIESQIYIWTGHEFNINSSQQLGRVLFEELKLPPMRKIKSGYSTDASVLESLRGIHPVIGYILDYRQLSKLKSTYVDALPALVNPETGRIHTSFNQMVTATGRLSSSDPNLQNIPIRTEAGRRIRQAFIAGSGSRLLGADYSQIELRVMAHISRDPNLLEAFANDEDIHTSTAAQVFDTSRSQVSSEMRRIAKIVNFGVIYGMSDYGLEQATSFTRSEAARFIESYFNKYPGIRDYLNQTKQQAMEKGYVQTLLGRRRYIPDLTSSNYQVRQSAERMAINMPIQGTAADIIKIAMINLQNRMNETGCKSKMILQVHDELLFEVPDDEFEWMRGLINDIMPGAMKLDVPLKIDIKSGRNWGETE